jgi:5-methyltetrahydrofolate--homocysteine methyltransferase
MSHPLQQLLNEKGVLLADGATGTNLFAEGLLAGEAPEVWNFEFPEKITKHHQSFVDAGADIILTNSFGGTKQRLKLHNLQDKVFEVNEAAAKIARSVADKAGRKVIVAGSVGPTGELFEPLGALTHDEAVASFADQIRGLKAGGIDVVWIETMSAAEEMQTAAIAAAQEGMPFIYTASFDTAGKTMMGVHPRDIHKVAEPLVEKPFAVGANCGVGASDILSSLLDMTDAAPGANVIVKGNCGIPEFRGSEIYYSGTPELMSEYARLAIDSGARIIGGCCGTSYGHLAAMRTAIDAHKKRARPTVAEVIEKIGPMRNKAAGEQGAEVKRERRGRRG